MQKGKDIFERNSSGELDERVWKKLTRQKLFSRNYAAEGLCAAIWFAGWSSDSGRVLMLVTGGEDKHKMEGRYLYYNVCKGDFELTPYLRKVKFEKPALVVCPEPLDNLPEEATLKHQLEQWDRKLNETYQRVLQKLDTAAAQISGNRRRIG